MNRLRIAVALTSFAALAACADGSTPTGAAPSQPAYGFGMGGGGVMPADTTKATTSSTTTAAPDSGQGRGGLGMGGAN